jgi:hypothetical protein
MNSQIMKTPHAIIRVPQMSNAPSPKIRLNNRVWMQWSSCGCIKSQNRWSWHNMGKKRCRQHSFKSISYCLIPCGLDTSDMKVSRRVVEQAVYLLLYSLPEKLKNTKLFIIWNPFFGNSNEKIFTIEHYHKIKALVPPLEDQRTLSS